MAKLWAAAWREGGIRFHASSEAEASEIALKYLKSTGKIIVRPVPDGLPTMEDLDRIAEEQQAREKTSASISRSEAEGEGRS